MKLDVSAGRSKKSYFDRCERFDLRASTPEEALWMAALARVITDGGVLSMTPRGRDPVVVEFAGVWNDPPKPEGEPA